MSDGPASLVMVTATASQGREKHDTPETASHQPPFSLGLPRNVFLEGAFVFHLGHVWASIFGHAIFSACTTSHKGVPETSELLSLNF